MLRNAKCPKRALTSTDIEEYLMKLTEAIKICENIGEVFTKTQILQIIHRTANQLADEPVMLEFEMPLTGLVIVGDLHGNINALFKTFAFHGFPPTSHYLFLGDYVDRGTAQVEVVLYLFLLKLAWPDHIKLLRGNHEVAEVTNRFHFRLECRRIFGEDDDLYLLFHQVFDLLPITAVVSDHFLICHGGVSQWMTCRENIRNLRKPMDVGKMKFAESCMVADILWADPNNVQTEPFKQSVRGIAYSFNKQGLQAVLDALHVKTLIRGHEYYPNGINRNFNDDSCFTVHTTTGHGESSQGATIKLLQRVETFEIAQHGAMVFDGSMPDLLLENVKMSLEECMATSSAVHGPQETCRWCEKEFPDYVMHRRCYISSEMVHYWVIKYAMNCMSADQTLRNYMHSEEQDYKINKRVNEFFPIFFDIVTLETQGGGTLRALISDTERDFYFKMRPGGIGIDHKVAFSQYVDIEEQKQAEKTENAFDSSSSSSSDHDETLSDSDEEDDSECVRRGALDHNIGQAMNIPGPSFTVYEDDDVQNESNQQQMMNRKSLTLWNSREKPNEGNGQTRIGNRQLYTILEDMEGEEAAYHQVMNLHYEPSMVISDSNVQRRWRRRTKPQSAPMIQIDENEQLDEPLVLRNYRLPTIFEDQG